MEADSSETDLSSWIQVRIFFFKQFEILVKQKFKQKYLLLS